MDKSTHFHGLLALHSSRNSTTLRAADFYVSERGDDMNPNNTIHVMAGTCRNAPVHPSVEGGSPRKTRLAGISPHPRRRAGPWAYEAKTEGR